VAPVLPVRVLWVPVSLDAAHNWHAGDLTDGQLLLAPIHGTAAVFFLEMHGHASAWRHLMQIREPWEAPLVVFRTAQLGLVRLGAVAGLEEPDGRTRYLLEAATMQGVKARVFGHRTGTTEDPEESAGQRAAGP
jgi:hypothetical protein